MRTRTQTRRILGMVAALAGVGLLTAPGAAAFPTGAAVTGTSSGLTPSSISIDLPVIARETPSAGHTWDRRTVDGYAADGYIRAGHTWDRRTVDGYASDGYIRAGHTWDRRTVDGYASDGYIRAGHTWDRRTGGSVERTALA